MFWQNQIVALSTDRDTIFLLKSSRASNSPPQRSSVKTFTLESAQKVKRNPLQKNKVKHLHQCKPIHMVKMLGCRMLALSALDL